MLVIFYLGVIGSMMWMLSTQVGVTCAGIKYTLVPFTRKNQPKDLQVEGKNFLIFVHDPSLLMG